MHYRTELMEEILTSQEAQKIIDYVTPKYGAAYVCLWLFQVIGIQLDIPKQFTEDFLNQVSPETATWSIPYWEKEYAIIPDPEWTDQQRREYIMARMQGHSPMNPRIMEQRLANILGIQTKINEFAGRNKFSVVVMKHLESADFKSIATEFIEKSKPAHLIYTLQFSDIVEADTIEYHYSVSVTTHEKQSTIQVKQ